jgi:hypothetical protein
VPTEHDVVSIHCSHLILSCPGSSRDLR